MGTVYTEQEMLSLGQYIGQHLEKNNIVLLVGDLGAGKTTLAKGIAKGLEIDEPVTSPTFVLINEYLSGRIVCYHMDLYRINSEEELYDLGIEEYLFGNGVCIIEWPNIATDFLPNDYTVVEITKTDIGRNVVVQKVIGKGNIKEAIDEYFSL